MKWVYVITFVAFAFFQSTPAMSQWGVEGGGTYNIQHGAFIAPCGCTFADGSGIGFGASLSYDLMKRSHFAFGLQAGVEYQSFTSREVIPESLSPITNGDKEEIKLTYLSFDPYVRYTIPSMGVFAQSAPVFEYLISSRFHHEAGSGADEEDAGLNPDTAIDIRSIRLLAKVSVGYTFSVAGVSLAPVISVGFPLNDLMKEQADGWRVSTYYASVAISF